jgi:isoquinoline 1-oxidoreductase subunit beta
VSQRSHSDTHTTDSHSSAPGPTTTRRRFIQYIGGGSATLLMGVTYVDTEGAQASISLPELGEILDFADVIALAEAPYASNLVLEVTADGRVRFELPRLDKGQGIATAFAMLVADELDADYSRTDVTLSDRRADRPFSITGNSAAVRALWEPVRKLCAHARARLVSAAARRWRVDARSLRTSQSQVIATDGRRASYGELTAEAALVLIPDISVAPKAVQQYRLVGTAHPRKNARDIVTGAQKYTLDVDVAGAMPAVVARAPDIGGTVGSWDGNVAMSMPGVVGVAAIPNGIAIVARTFQQAFDARDALQITWRRGPARGLSDANVRNTLQRINTPLTPLLPLIDSLTATFEFPYLAHATMEVMAAIADVRGHSAEIWYASQSPNYIAAQISQATGIPASRVKIHVPFAGGSFGRRLFGEAAVEAALISKALAMPVKLMWTRNDDMRHGRFRPMSRCSIRATWLGGTTLSFEHHMAAARNDFRHGLGDALTAAGVNVVPDLFNQVGFVTMISLPYRFGSTSTRLVEREFKVPTGSWRSVYSALMTAANEIFIDEMARARGYDEVDFRLRHLDSSAAERCLRHVSAAGNWGRTMPMGQAQGIAVHAEYRSAVAYLVEIDTTGSEPRLMKAYCAVDVGVPINPAGLAAQMQGSLIDAWSAMFRAGNHLDDGRIREGSFGDFLWARMRHSPIDTEVHVFPSRAGEEPGGAGELGITAAAAACVNAHARATGTQPRRFPIQEFT